MKNNIVLYSLYLSIFLFMGMTPNIGYIQIGVFKITTMLIPVIIMTYHLEWKGGLMAGLFFGITSFINGIAYGTILIDLVHGLGNYFVLTIIMRLVLGMFLSLTIMLLKNTIKIDFLKMLILTLVGLVLNALFFLSSYSLMSGKAFIAILISIGMNTSIEWPLTILVCLAFIPALKHLKKKKYEGY